MADFPWNNNFGTPTPAPAPVDDSEPVNEAGQADDSENWSASDEDSQPDVQPEETDSVDETTPDREEETSVKGAKTTRRKTAKKNSSFPHLEAASYAKIKDMLDVLSDDRTANIAKILCETSKTDAPVLLEVLTETKTRKRVAEFSKFVKELAGAQPSDLKMRLAFAFMEDKTLSKTLFTVLNAAEPDRGFGRASGEPMKDVNAVAEHWGDGVDLSVVEKLKI